MTEPNWRNRTLFYGDNLDLLAPQPRIVQLALPM